MLKEHCDTNLTVESYTSKGKDSFTAERKYYYKDGHLCLVCQRVNDYTVELPVTKEVFSNDTTVCYFGSGESIVYDSNKRILMRNFATSSSKFSEVVSESFTYNEGIIKHYAVSRNGEIVSITHYESDSWSEVSFISKKDTKAVMKTIRMPEEFCYTVTETSEKESSVKTYWLKMLNETFYVVKEYRDGCEIVKRSRTCVTRSMREGYTHISLSMQNSPRSEMWLTHRTLSMVLYGDKQLKSFTDETKAGVLHKEFK